MSNDEEVHAGACGKGGLSKVLLACSGSKSKPKVRSDSTVKDEDDDASEKASRVASHRSKKHSVMNGNRKGEHRFSTASQKTDGSTGSSLPLFAMTSRFLKKKDKFCRECGTKLNESHSCPVCGDATSDTEDESEEPQEKTKGQIQSRLSVSRQRRARRATLNKYMAVVQKHEGKGFSSEVGGSQESREKLREDFQASETTRRLKKVYSLKEDFFGKSAEGNASSGSFSPKATSNVVFRELKRKKDKRASKRGSSEEAVSLELVEVPEEHEEHYNKDIDKFLAESLKDLERNKKALLQSEKQLHTTKIKRIKDLRNNLLSEQDAMINEMWHQSKAIIKGLRKHVQQLEALLQQKFKEGDEYDAERTNQIAELEALQVAFSTADGKEETREFEDVFHERKNRPENASNLLQQRYESKLDELQEKLAAAVGHLNELELEQYFPKCMQWKVRLNSGDGLFIGMRDLDLETLDANIVVGRGDELGTVIMEVSDIRAIVGIYQFSINGNTATAKLLRGLLTPTVNRLDLEISGNWYLKLRFKPGTGEADLRPKWVKEESRFDLRLTKETAGAGLLLLPDRVIRWLTTSLLPSVISSTIMLNLPIRLGSFFKHPQNYIRLTGKIRLKGEIPPRVWCAPLVGPTQSAKYARKAMGITDEEAVLLDLMFRSDLATYAGFHRKAISMARMYKWRLQYASQPISKLSEMLELIETNPHILLQQTQNSDTQRTMPKGSAMQMLSRVCELAVKPVTLDLEILDIEADVNIKQAMDIFTGMYIESLEHEVEKASGSRAIRAAEKKVRTAKERAEKVESYLEKYIAPILSDKVEFDFTFVAMGGIVPGILMASLRNLVADLRLPSRFEVTQLFGEAIELSKGFNLTIQGQTGPGEGEYTLKAKHKWVDPSESSLPENVPDDDAQAIIRDLQLNLFPRLTTPGTIRLLAESVKASWFLCSLAEALGTEPVNAIEEVASRRRASSAVPSLQDASGKIQSGNGSVDDLLERSKTLLSDLWTRYYQSRSGNQGTPNSGTSGGKSVTEHPYLPRILSDERYDLQIDVRAVKIQAIREIGVDQKDTIRVTISRSPQATISEDENIAAMHLRFNLSEIFEAEEV